MIISYIVFGPAGPAGFLGLLVLFCVLNNDCREMIADEWKKIKEEEKHDS